MTFGVLMTLLNIVSQIRTPITGVSGLIPQYFSALASAERIMELEDIPDEPSALDSEDIDKIYDNMSELSIRDVNFSYDGAHNVLKNASLSVKKGEAVALKGVSGEGKSTISGNIAAALTLMGKKVGDTANIRVPQGEIELEITSISYDI